MQENLIKEQLCQSEKLFQEMLFFHEFAYHFVYVKVNHKYSRKLLCLYMCLLQRFQTPDFKTRCLQEMFSDLLK